MSATNRGAIRNESDFYETPEWCIDLFLKEFGRPRGHVVLEPCAGNGAIVKSLRKNFDNEIHIVANEIREEETDNLFNAGANEVFSYNFLEIERFNTMNNLIITNPPFSIAQEIIEKCFELAPKAEIVMLLRLGFLAHRKKFWDKHPLTQLYILSTRPSFGKHAKCSVKICDWQHFYQLGETPLKQCPICGSKLKISSNDSSEYGWFVWSPYREQLIKSI